MTNNANTLVAYHIYHKYSDTSILKFEQVQPDVLSENLENLNLKVFFDTDNNAKPASVVQLDARWTGDQEVAGATPTRSATICGDLIMKYFLHLCSPFR